MAANAGVVRRRQREQERSEYRERSLYPPFEAVEHMAGHADEFANEAGGGVGQARSACSFATDPSTPPGRLWGSEATEA